MVFSFFKSKRGGQIGGAVFTALGLFAMGAIVTGCGQHQGATDNAGSAIILATVNGEPITQAEHYDALQHFVPAAITGYPQNPILAQPSGRTALQNLIENTLTLQLAKANDVPVKQSQVDALYNDSKILKEAALTQTFETYLTSQGYTPDQYKQEVLEPQVAQLNLLAKTVTVTPDELQAAYNSSTANYTIPTRVHVHRIATATKADADEVYKSMKDGQTMLSLMDRNIAADGAGGNPDDSTDVAQWINIDRPSPVLGAAGALLKNAKPGDIVPPVQVQGQWWVMQVADRRPSQVLSFPQVEDLVRINVIRQKAGQQALVQFQNALMQQMQRAVITIVPPQYQSLAVELHNAGLTQAARSIPANPAPAAKPATPPAAPPVVVVPNAPPK